MSYFEEMTNLVNLKKLVDSGVALIPVNSIKEPFASFKGKSVNSLSNLVDAFRYYSQNSGIDVNKVAIRTGVVSNGLICIDVDSKHKPGFSERIYMDFRELFSDLWEKLRIEKTPSGGLHIYYFLSECREVSTANLAHRVASDEELILKPKENKKCFLELKASNGSLCTCFPSVGYSVVKDAKSGYFGTLSLDEHKRLIEFCYLYEEVVKEEAVKIKTSSKGIYKDGMTPFDEFNVSEKGSQVLIDLGWKAWKSSGVRDTFIKPGKKDKEIGASFNREKRTYAIYTTNAGIETKCYNPSSLLCSEKFSGKWDECYAWLVSEGFGKLKHFIEKEEIKKALKEDRELPANISIEGKERFENEKKRIGEKYKFGEFWIEKKEGEYEISREMICRVSSEFGFRSYKEKVVLIEGYLIKEISDREYFDSLKSYIDQPENIDLLDEYEKFLQNSGKFTITRLEPLDLSIVLKSTKKESYKFFSNCYILISAESVELIKYEDLKYKIWEKDIKKRPFELISSFKGLYWNFIQNAIGWNQYIMKCIGFYAHDFRDEESYLIITTEKCEDPKDGGGSGKNVFWKLFGLTTSFKSTAASMIKKDNQFLQSWNGERVFVLADMPRNFDLIFFKDMVTDGAVVRKLYKDEYNVDVSEMAKLGISGNYSVDDADPGIKRRLRMIEFSDYYTVNGGVKKVHDGKMFPKDWDENEYLMFDNIMAVCIQEYLIGDSIIEKLELSDTGWAKKQQQNHKHLYDFIKNYIDGWISLGRVSNKVFNDQYVQFRIDSNIGKPMTSFSINKAIVDYCNHFSIPFIHSYRKKNGEMSDGLVWKENGISVKGRFFGEEAKKFIERNGIIFEDGELVKSDEEVKEELPF